MVYKEAVYITCLKEECKNHMIENLNQLMGKLNGKRDIAKSLDGRKAWIEILEDDFAKRGSGK